MRKNSNQGSLLLSMTSRLPPSYYQWTDHKPRYSKTFFITFFTKTQNTAGPDYGFIVHTGPQHDVVNQTYNTITPLKKMNNNMTKDDFVAILKEIGLTEEQMHQLHQKMEQRFPESHQRFLEFLGIADDEAAQIRTQSK